MASGMVDRVRGRAASLNGNTGSAAAPSMRDMSIALDEWASYFSFGGLTYPLIQTTMGSVDKERIAGNAIAAFQGVSSVFSLIQARVQIFAQIRFQWTRFTGAQPGDLFGTDDLRILEKPWPNGSTAKLLARMEIDNCIGGNAYIVRSRKDRLARLRPDLVTIALGSEYDMESPADAPDVEIAGFAYFPRSGKPEWFWPWECAHYAPMPDPNFQFLGMSWMTPCLREIQSDALTTEHKYRFFANAATPNLAIKFDPTIGIEAVKAFKALVENDHKGAFNAYKTLYLGGGADPVPIGTNMQQLDFAVTQGHGEARLAASAGIPASWVGFSEGLQGSSLNAGNFNAQRRRLMDGPQPLDAKVLTPTGWTTMGQLGVGDLVTGSDGLPHGVTGIFPLGEDDVYRVTFAGGAAVECTADHLWEVSTHYDRRRGKTQTRVVRLSEIMEGGLRYGDGSGPSGAEYRGGPRKWAVRLVEPVTFQPAGELPIPPYLLGALIGDGSLGCGRHGITFCSSTADADDWEARLLPLLPAGVTIDRRPLERGAALHLKCGGRGGGTRHPLIASVKQLGLWGHRSWEKFIPSWYKRADVIDRVALLQGLLDTDGTVSREYPTQVQLTTTSPQLAADVSDLVGSLGGFATISGPRMNRGSARPAYAVIIKHLPEWITPFRLSRKARLYRAPVRTGRTRSICSVEHVGRKQVQCIRVDSSDHLYVTDGYVLTHNTMNHLWMEAAQSLEAVCPPPDSHASLWFDARIPSMREDAQDIATIQQLQAQTIAALVMQGYTPDSVVKAVVRNDMGLLKHSGNLSVQLHPGGQPATARRREAEGSHRWRRGERQRGRAGIGERVSPGRRVRSMGELERPGDYFGPVRGWTGDKEACFYVLPVCGPRGSGRFHINHVCFPPHTYRECSDGSLEIRDSILHKAEQPDYQPCKDAFHGYLDEGNTWRQVLGAGGGRASNPGTPCRSHRPLGYPRPVG